MIARARVFSSSLLCLPPAAVWLVFWVAFFPALMNGDSIHSWAEVSINAFDQSQTGFVPIVYSWLAHLWYTPAVISLAHIVLMLLLLRHALVVLEDVGAPFWVLALVSAYFTASPFVAVSLVTIIKDTPSAMIQLLVVLFGIRILASRGQWLREPRNVAWLGISLALMCLVRHEGWISALTFIALLAVFYRGSLKHVAVVAVTTLVLTSLAQGPLFWLYRVSNNADVETVVMQSAQIAVVVSNGGAITPAEKTVLEKIAPIEAWKTGYSPYTLNNVIFFNPSYTVGKAYENRTSLAAVWKPIAIRNWRILLASRGTLGALAWEIVQPPGSFTYAVHLEAVPAGIDPNAYGLHLTHPLPGVEAALRAFLSVTSGPALNWIFYRPALYLYVILACFCVLMYALRSIRPLLLVAPLVPRIAVIVLFALSPDSRFYLYAFFIAPVMVAYTITVCRGGDRVRMPAP